MEDEDEDGTYYWYKKTFQNHLPWFWKSIPCFKWYRILNSASFLFKWGVGVGVGVGVRVPHFFPPPHQRFILNLFF